MLFRSPLDSAADGDQVPFPSTHRIFHGLGAGLKGFRAAEMMKALSLLRDLGVPVTFRGPGGGASSCTHFGGSTAL